MTLREETLPSLKISLAKACSNDFFTADTAVLFLTDKDAAAKDFPHAEKAVKIFRNDSRLLDFGALTNFIYETENGLKKIVIVSLGREAELTLKKVRKAAAEALRAITAASSAKNICVHLPQAEAKGEEFLETLAEGLLLGAYEYTEYKTKPPVRFEGVIGFYADSAKLDRVLSHSRIMSESVCWARDLVNRPGNVLQPQAIADEAKLIAEKLQLNFEELGKTEMEALSMGALLAAAKGSNAEPKLVTLKYQGAKDGKWTAFVGKGITFDSGGISIKPAEGMGEMKDDMAGAAVVIAAVAAIARLALPCNVMAIAACAENMPSGSAARPGDIVAAANGKTIEIVSTDAEGRMVLADAVWYACRQGAAKVIDVATLTGAAIVALGNETAAIISNDDGLSAALTKAGETAGESFWRLPSLPECREAIKGETADLVNSAGKAGGVITGGLFIEEFVDAGLPWAHLDIGGTASAQKTGGWWAKGATGMGVATLVAFMKEQ